MSPLHQSGSPSHPHPHPRVRRYPGRLTSRWSPCSQWRPACGWCSCAKSRRPRPTSRSSTSFLTPVATLLIRPWSFHLKRKTYWVSPEALHCHSFALGPHYFVVAVLTVAIYVCLLGLPRTKQNTTFIGMQFTCITFGALSNNLKFRSHQSSWRWPESHGSGFRFLAFPPLLSASPPTGEGEMAVGRGG